jgi:AcrR family transcriptional regulator
MARTVAADYDEKAAAILEAAAAVFAARGYQRATLADVARAAGFAKPSLYHYFGSKDALLYALLDRSLDALLDAVIAADPGPDVAPEARLERVVEAYAGAFLERVSVVTPLLLHLEYLRPEWREAIKRKERRLIELIGSAAAPASDSLPPHVAAFLVLGAANWTHYWFDPRGDVTAGALARGMATLFAATIRGTEPGRAQAPSERA